MKLHSKIVSVKVVAEFLDVTPRRVQQLAKLDKIPKVARGRYDLIPAIHGYIQHMRDLITAYSGCGKFDVDDFIENGAEPIDLEEWGLENITFDEIDLNPK
jgi:hypothetical protein